MQHNTAPPPPPKSETSRAPDFFKVRHFSPSARVHRKPRHRLTFQCVLFCRSGAACIALFMCSTVGHNNQRVWGFEAACILACAFHFENRDCDVRKKCNLAKKWLGPAFCCSPKTFWDSQVLCSQSQSNKYLTIQNPPGHKNQSELTALRITECRSLCLGRDAVRQKHRILKLVCSTAVFASRILVALCTC